MAAAAVGSSSSSSSLRGELHPSVPTSPCNLGQMQRFFAYLRKDSPELHRYFREICGVAECVTPWTRFVNIVKRIFGYGDPVVGVRAGAGSEGESGGNDYRVLQKADRAVMAYVMQQGDCSLKSTADRIKQLGQIMQQCIAEQKSGQSTLLKEVRNRLIYVESMNIVDVVMRPESSADEVIEIFTQLHEAVPRERWQGLLLRIDDDIRHLERIDPTVVAARNDAQLAARRALVKKRGVLKITLTPKLEAEYQKTWCTDPWKARETLEKQLTLCVQYGLYRNVYARHVYESITALNGSEELEFHGSLQNNGAARQECTALERSYGKHILSELAVYDQETQRVRFQTDAERLCTMKYTMQRQMAYARREENLVNTKEGWKQLSQWSLAVEEWVQKLPYTERNKEQMQGMYALQAQCMVCRLLLEFYSQNGYERLAKETADQLKHNLDALYRESDSRQNQWIGEKRVFALRNLMPYLELPARLTP